MFDLLPIKKINEEANRPIYPANVSGDKLNLSIGDKTSSNKEYFDRPIGMVLLEKGFIDSYIIDDMYVECKKEGGYFVCYDEITHMQGIGLDENEAKYNYRLVLLDFYEFLTENKNNLLPSDEKSLNFLKDIISKM